MRLGSVVFSLWLGLCTTGYAVERPLPLDGKIGELSVSPQRQFLIDGDVRRLTAGAQIRTVQNTLIQPQVLIAKLAGLKALILYTENNQRQVHRIWLLTKQEARRNASKLPPPPLPLVTIPDREARSPVIPADRTATPAVPTE